VLCAKPTFRVAAERLGGFPPTPLRISKRASMAVSFRFLRSLEAVAMSGRPAGSSGSFRKNN
jgi:hypothetical protein